MCPRQSGGRSRVRRSTGVDAGRNHLVPLLGAAIPGTRRRRWPRDSRQSRVDGDCRCRGARLRRHRCRPGNRRTLPCRSLSISGSSRSAPRGCSPGTGGCASWDEEGRGRHPIRFAPLSSRCSSSRRRRDGWPVAAGKPIRIARCRRCRRSQRIRAATARTTCAVSTRVRCASSWAWSASSSPPPAPTSRTSCWRAASPGGARSPCGWRSAPAGAASFRN